MIDLTKLVDYTKAYCNKYNIDGAPEALRVEQGEYIVTTLDNMIGTYNVHQCAVIYVRNKSLYKHGLAHIDGYTEIASLEKFFAELFQNTAKFEFTNICKDYSHEIEIIVIGAYTSSLKSGAL